MTQTATHDIRLPAVAGAFYPADPRQLQAMIEGFLAEWRHRGRPVPVRGAMVPHAGLVYSGICAASVFSRIRVPDTVVILSPNHRGIGTSPTGISLWARGAFSTPLGEVPVDADFAAELLERCPLVHEDRTAHLPEHGIEVELPFLQTVAPHASIVPVVLIPDAWRICLRLAEVLAEMAEARSGRVLILASSDMNHFEPATVAADKDAQALAALEALDGEQLLRVCHARGISMCGRAPAAIMAEVARRLGARQARVIDYRHSGMVSGDFDSVVGYAAAIAE